MDYVSRRMMSAPKKRVVKLPFAQGTLIPIGGGEDKTDRETVLERVVFETGKKKPRICLVTLATTVPKEVASDYRSAFKNLGITKINTIHFEARPEADKEINLKKARNCDVVLFSGGNQLRLTSLLGGTRLLDLIKERYFNENNFVVAGTSAGAAAMSDTMIVAGSSRDAMIKGELELTNGLDIIKNIFIDTHFTERGRFGRVIQTVACNPGILGLGLGEDTAVVIYKGSEMEVVGSGLVVIVDGFDIQYTDLTEISNGAPITVEGLKMHVLGPGKRFLLDERKVAQRDKKLKERGRGK